MNPRPLLVLLALCALIAASWPATAGATQPRTLVVGEDYATIQSAVDASRPGDTVFVPDGTYQEAVFVSTSGITLRGESREGVVLESGGVLDNGVTVTADDVTVTSMTAQNYASNGFVFAGVTGFTMHDLHAKDNAVYGLYAIHSTGGDIRYSYAEGHGDAGLYIGETHHCDCDVHHNVAWNNMLGYSGTANSHLRIWANEFHDNRAGILMSVLPQEMGVEMDGDLYGTQVHTEIYDNYVHDNNNKDTPQSGIWNTVHVPVGEGITIAGGWFNDVHDNVIVDNDLWGVGVFWLTTPPRGNHIHDNTIQNSRFGIWWDEWGEDHCFGGNDITGTTHRSDPVSLPSCPGLVGDLPCPDATQDWAACRASDARAPNGIKETWLTMRSLQDLDPYEDPFPYPGPFP